MNRDDKHSQGPDDGEEFSESHAADEPTAVWDEGALRAAGLGDLLKQRGVDAAPPATPAATAGGNAPTIVVDQTVGLDQPMPETTRTPAPPAPAPRGLGWGATLALAVGLGVLVYVLIRLFKT